MKLQLINDINTLKSTDNATQIELAVLDEQQQFIELSTFASITVNIGANGSLYSSESPVIDTETNTFSFTLSNALPVGKYQIQVHLVTDDGKLHIAPHKGAETLTIEKSFNEIGGETIVVMTIQQLLDDMASTLRVAEESNNKSDAAIVKADSAIDIANIATTDAATAITLANEAKSTANSAVTSADNANTKADTAINTANDALTVAQQAIETANSADAKADNANNHASTANDTANNADAKADSAVSTADNAIMIAQQVREEFTNLTEGNTDAELIAARTDEENVTHESLKKRIDSEAIKRNVSDVETLQSAKDYTDSKVGGIDLSTLATKGETADALQNAKDYVDNQIGNVDLSSYATKNELNKKYTKPTNGIAKSDLDSSVQSSLSRAETALQSVTKESVGLSNVDNTSDANKPISAAMQVELDNKVNVIIGKGLSTNDYTTEEKNKLANLQNIDMSSYATKTEVDKKANSALEYKKEATLQNGWAGILMYFKDNFGIVHVMSKGELRSGVTARNTVLTNLPVGYRPYGYETFYNVVLTGSSATGSVRISGTDGNIILESDVSNFLYLNFSFPTHR